MDCNRVEQIIERALAEHARVVTEPPRGYYVDADGNLLRKSKGGFVEATTEQEVAHTAKHIIKYINEGLEWNKRDPYKNSWNIKVGGFSWCGAFPAYCDPDLKYEIRHEVMPSTYRLREFCKGTPRDIPLDEIQRGDLVVVGRKGGKRWGAHITRVLEVGETHVKTIEGNAHGRLGNGTWGEGVITRRRPFKGQGGEKESFVLFAYRFLEEDYDA